MTIRWVDEGENSLWLVTPDEFARLPDGIELECINRTTPIKIKGKDKFDGDTRGGHLAYGIRNPFNGKYKNELLLILLAQNH